MLNYNSILSISDITAADQGSEEVSYDGHSIHPIQLTTIHLKAPTSKSIKLFSE